MSRFTGLAAAALIGIGAFGAAGSVNAAPCTGATVGVVANTTDVNTTYPVGQSDPSLECIGLVDQEAPPESIVDLPGMGDLLGLGTTTYGALLGDWSFVAKYDFDDDKYTPNAQTTLQISGSGSSGDFTINNPVAGNAYSIGIGAGQRYAIYLLDLTNATNPITGTWLMSSFLNAGGQEPDISNLSLYTAMVVPLPAAAWLMLAGLGGLVLVARRRKVI